MVSRRAEIRPVIPAPLAAVVPAWKRILEPGNSLAKQAGHDGIVGLEMQVIKTYQRSEEAVENARGWATWSLRVKDFGRRAKTGLRGL